MVKLRYEPKCYGVYGSHSYGTTSGFLFFLTCICMCVCVGGVQDLLGNLNKLQNELCIYSLKYCLWGEHPGPR